MRERLEPGEPFGCRLYFDDGEIDSICLDALKSAGCLPPTPAPIEIDLFLEKHFGCSVIYDDLPPGFLGFALFGVGGVVDAVGVASTLLYDGRTGERRTRATLAHEAGHCLLHSKLLGEEHERHPLLDESFDYDRNRIMCRKEDIGTGAGRYNGKWWEWQANQAIGGLLLPRQLVEACVELFTEPSGSWGLSEVPARNRDRAVQRVANEFEVNHTVAQIRLQTIFPENDQLKL